MKAILGLAIAISLFATSNSVAGSAQLSCKAYSTDGKYTELNHFTVFYDTNNGVDFSFFRNGVNHQYHFRYTGAVNKKLANITIAQVGQYIHWTEDTFGQNPWVDIASPVQGYIRAQKGKHKVLKKGIIGDAVIPFINGNQRVIVKCVDVDWDGNDCWFGCN